MEQEPLCIGNVTDRILVTNVLVIIYSVHASQTDVEMSSYVDNKDSTFLKDVEKHKKYSWLVHSGHGPSIWSPIPEYPYPYTGELTLYSRHPTNYLQLIKRGTLKELGNVDFLRYKDDYILGEEERLWDRRADVYSGPQMYNNVHVRGLPSKYVCRENRKQSNKARKKIRAHVRDVLYMFRPTANLELGNQPRRVYMRFHPRGKRVATNLTTLAQKSQEDFVVAAEIRFLRGHRIQRGTELVTTGMQLLTIILKPEIYTKLVSDPSVCVMAAQYKFLDMRIHIDVPIAEVHKLDLMLENPSV